jgi:hypothetical protein
VAGVYFGSHWYYGDVEPVEIPEASAPTPPLPKNPSSAKVDLSGLQGESLPPQTESKPTVSSAEGESVNDFLAGLSDEEKALLTAEVVEPAPRVSPFGFGPYPQVPLDFPRDPIWEAVDMYEKINQRGRGMMKVIELMDRVLIKLWSQGHTATSASMSDGLVYPGFPNTVYVEWDYIEELDGTITRYAGRITSGPDISDSVFDALGDGIIPPGITVLDHNADGIDPYTFLNLNR